MKLSHLILLNGPPRCGKDTAGEILAKRIWRARTAKVSAELKRMTHRLYGVRGRQSSPFEPAVYAWHDHFEASKDEPRAEFLGLTPRKAYIAVSELLLKPLHGEDALGKMLARSIHPEGVLIVTDSGFRAEAEPLVAMAERAMLVHVHREGCTFDGDSRDYWNWRAPHGPERSTIEVVNPGTLDGYERVLEGVIEWAK
jgi:hypothetical protein